MNSKLQKVSLLDCDGSKTIYYRFVRNSLEVGQIMQNIFGEWLAYVPRLANATELRMIASKLDKLNSGCSNE